MSGYESIREVLDDIKDEIDGVKEHLSDTPGYQKDLAYVYAKGTFKVAKLYGPAIAIGGTSIAALTSSHMQLSRRNTALTAAYAGLHQAYNEYRNRVRDAVGKKRNGIFTMA